MASAAKSAPAAFNPFNAMNTSPGFTWRESYARPRMSIPGSAASFMFGRGGPLPRSAPLACGSFLVRQRRESDWRTFELQLTCHARLDRRSRCRRLTRHDAIPRKARGQTDFRQDTQRFARAQPAEIRKIAHVAVRADLNESRRRAGCASESAGCSVRRATSTGGGAFSVGGTPRCRSVASAMR